MPELPEVETVCRGLSSKILNLTIKKIEVINYRLRYFIPESILDLMPKRKIKRIIRRSKIGIFLLDGPYNLYFHLGMTGKFIIYEGPYLVNKHDHLIIKLSNGITVIYNDVRKFGYIKLLKKPLDIVQFKNLGIEPSLTYYFRDCLFDKLKKLKRAIKDILLDQKYICGIGNIYANEALYHAKISPFRTGDSLNKLEFYRLLCAVQEILKKSIDKGGSSIKDYVHITQELGYFQTEFKVYGKNKLNCENCKSLILKERQNGRSTFYCKSCQK